MTSSFSQFGVLWLSLVCADAPPSGNNNDLSGIITKAAQAMGIKDTKYTTKGFYLKSEGYAYLSDVKYTVIRDVYVSFSGRKRSQFTVVLEGRKEKSITVIDKDHGWLRDRNRLNEPFRTDDLSKGRLTQETESLDLLSMVLFPSRLKDPAVKKTLLPPKDIKRKNAVAIGVSGLGFGSATLFFDKSGGYLSGWEQRRRDDLLAEKQYNTIAGFLSERQKLGPLTIPTHEKVFYNGILVIDWKWIELRTFEKELDPKLFEKP